MGTAPVSIEDIFQINVALLSTIASGGRETCVARALENVVTSDVQAYVTRSIAGPNLSFLPALLGKTVARESEALEQRFHEQASKWASETEHLSSPAQMMLHPSYQAILGMAREDEEEIIRLMLRDLRDNRRLWFWALSYLTRENPIKREDAGKLDRMIKAWIDWGKQRGKL
jgi:hypothetical protein